MPDYNLKVNGKTVTVNAPADIALLWVQRDKHGINGQKYGCGVNVCKACTCLVGGKAVTTCATKVSAVGGREITTIEGLAQGDTLHPVQQAWLELAVAQCGYCQSGQMMGASALLSVHPDPSDAQIDAAMAGHLCRCGTYDRIRSAIHRAARILRERGAR